MIGRPRALVESRLASALCGALLLCALAIAPKTIAETQDELDKIVLENFHLEKVPFDQALWKWRAALKAAGGKKIFSFNVESINNLSGGRGEQAKTPIDLSFRYVLAGECLRRIVQQVNQRARGTVFEVRWYSETGFSVYATITPRGLEKAREVRLKSFKVRDSSLLNLVRDWRAAVKRDGPERKNEIYYKAYEIKETFKVPLPIELNLTDVPALEALQAICDKSRSTVKWDNFGSYPGEQWDFEIMPLVMQGGDADFDAEREWTNKEGKSVRAIFLLVENDIVRLRTSGGKIFDYPLENLSPEGRLQALRLARTGLSS